MLKLTVSKVYKCNYLELQILNEKTTDLEIFVVISENWEHACHTTWLVHTLIEIMAYFYLKDIKEIPLYMFKGYKYLKWTVFYFPIVSPVKSIKGRLVGFKLLWFHLVSHYTRYILVKCSYHHSPVLQEMFLIILDIFWLDGAITSFIRGVSHCTRYILVKWSYHQFYERFSSLY